MVEATEIGRIWRVIVSAFACKVYEIRFYDSFKPSKVKHSAMVRIQTRCEKSNTRETNRLQPPSCCIQPPLWVDTHLILWKDGLTVVLGHVSWVGPLIREVLAKLSLMFLAKLWGTGIRCKVHRIVD